MIKANEMFSEVMYTINNEEIKEIEEIERKIFEELSDEQHEYLLCVKEIFFEVGYNYADTDKKNKSLFKKLENYGKI